jgi:hypothetical protein
MPPLSVFAWTVSIVPLGIARGAIEAFVSLAGTKSRLGVVRSLRDRELVQATVGRAETQHSAARALLTETMSELMAATDIGGERLIADSEVFAPVLVDPSHDADRLPAIITPDCHASMVHIGPVAGWHSIRHSCTSRFGCNFVGAY